MSHLLQPQIVILKEGTEDASGRGQILSNINACNAVVDVVKTTLGKLDLNFFAQRNWMLLQAYFGATFDLHLQFKISN